jgi:hypothetical protein
VGRASRQGSGKQKSTNVEQKMVTLIYPYPNYFTLETKQFILSSSSVKKMAKDIENVVKTVFVKHCKNFKNCPDTGAK